MNQYRLKPMTRVLTGRVGLLLQTPPDEQVRLRWAIRREYQLRQHVHHQGQQQLLKSVQLLIVCLTFVLD